MAIREKRHARGVLLLDTSGSVTDDGSVDIAAAVVGVDRIVFGCNSSMTTGVGKIHGANTERIEQCKGSCEMIEIIAGEFASAAALGRLD
jgi:hypothetical protein